jgi:gluconolactonase
MADTAFTEITTGLQFPEGPVAMPDGSVILTELFASRLTRVAPDGTKTTVAEINGSPNGLAVGPDGALYLCNNGNAFTPLNMGGLLYPGPFDESKYIGGRIQRVDIATGTVTDLYTHCGDTQLRAPNDIVFDKHGGFYFTDHGTRSERSADRTGIYYA